MRVGILTYHDADNYGAVLQAFALKESIRLMGHNAEIIDYKCPFIENGYNSFFINSWFDCLKVMIRLPKYNIMRKRFKEFRTVNLNLSRKIYTMDNKDDLNAEYDVFVVGSDQVWNYSLNQMDATYLLDFAEMSKKRISYAASTKLRTLPKWAAIIYKFYLEKFDAIGVREKSVEKLIAPLYSGNVIHNVDPVLLYSKNEWEKLIADRLCKRDYVFVYYIGDISKKGLKKIKEIIQKESIKVINISNSLKRYSNIKNVRDAGPAEFLNYIYYSKAVVTNSFHASAFSIQFEKNLYIDTSYMIAGEIDPRYESLVELSGLKNVYIDEIHTDILQYNKELLEKNIKRSKDYLKGILDF